MPMREMNLPLGVYHAMLSITGLLREGIFLQSSMNTRWNWPTLGAGFMSAHMVMSGSLMFVIIIGGLTYLAVGPGIPSLDGLGSLMNPGDGVSIIMEGGTGG